MNTNQDERARTLRRVSKLSELLDNAFKIPGINYRVGIDPLIGLIPGAGDVVSFGLSAYLLLEAKRLGAPGKTIARMLLNLLLDTLVGAIPIAGDVFDATYKANARNMKLLTRHLGTQDD